MEGFGIFIRAIIDATIGVAEPITDTLGYIHLAGMVFIVSGLLFSFYFKPPKTKKWRIILALSFFAVVAICCMSLWYWFIGTLRGDAS